MPGRISRNRGYSFEHMLDKWVNSLQNWHCRRLGGSSANMPDLLCINNITSTIRVSECKSLMTKNEKALLYIPADQIQRCITFSEIFQVYKTREVIFSFKFGRGYGKSYFFVLDRKHYNEILNANVVYVRCSYNGQCVVVIQHLPNTKYCLTLRSRQNLIT